MKRKKIGSLILLVFATIISCGVFGHASLSSLEAKAVTINHKYYQKNSIDINSVGVNAVYGDDSNLLNYWAYKNDNWLGADFDSSKYNSSGEIYHTKGSSSSVSPYNAYFYQIYNISSNLLIAGLRNSANLTISVDVKSDSKPESIYVYLYSGSAGANNPLNYDEFSIASTFTSTLSPVSSSSYVTVTFSNIKIDQPNFMLYVYSQRNDGTNSIYVREPVITVSTTDSSAPTACVMVGNSKTALTAGAANGSEVLGLSWAKSRTLTFSDSGCGIQTIEVSTDGGQTYSVLKDFTTNFSASAFDSDSDYAGSYSHVLTANGTYHFKVTDNVGNSADYVWVESRVDTIAPTFSVSGISAAYVGRNIEFTALLSKNDELSDVTFTYYYVFESIESEKFDVEFADGEQVNTLVAPHLGDYTLIFEAVDEAGNYACFTLNANGELVPATGSATGAVNYISYTFSVRDEVSLTLTESSLTYAINGVSLGLSLGINGGYEFDSDYGAENLHVALTIDGESVAANWNPQELAEIVGALTCNLNAGDHTLSYRIDDELYFGEGEIEFNVLQREVTLTAQSTSFTYNATAWSLEISDDADTDLAAYSVLYYQVSRGEEGEIRTLVAENKPISAGRYVAVFTLNFEGASNYVITNPEIEFEVTKLKLTVSAKNAEITYGEAVPALSGYSLSCSAPDELSFNLSYAGLEGNLSESGFISAGSYTILVSYDLSDEVFENYDIELVSGTLLVNKRAVSVSITETPSKMYGDEDPDWGNVDFSTSMALGEQTLINELIGSDTITVSFTRESGENAGAYDILLGESVAICNPNYEIQLNYSRFEITKRFAIVSIESCAKTYGDVDPTFIFHDKNGNILEADLAQFGSSLIRDAGEDAGSYKIYFNEDALSNYIVISISGTLTIEKKAISVNILNVTTTYGEEVSFKYEILGLENNDSITLELEILGEYVAGEHKILITQSILTNYEIITINNVPLESYLAGNNNAILTINKAELSENEYALADKVVTYTGESVFVDEIDSEFEFCYVYMINVDGEFVEVAGAVNAGKYYVYAYFAGDENHLEFTTNLAELTINKAELFEGDYVLADKVVTYTGESVFVDEIDSNFEFSYVYMTEIDGKFVDVQSAVNAGEYYVYAYFVGDENYLEFTTNLAELTINKAELSESEFALADETLTYTGSELTISGIDSNFEFSYVYKTSAGALVSSVIDAGEYYVYAYFVGDENHYDFTTNVATLTVGKKLLPITLKTLTFLYDGTAKSPEYEINTAESVSVIVNFEIGYYPTEIGSYAFSIKSNSANYYTEITGTLNIVSSLSSVNSYGAVSSSNTSGMNLAVEIVRDDSSNLKNAFTSSTNGRSCISVYKFVNVEEYAAGEVYVVKIKAVSNAKNVKIYVAGASGEISEVNYTTDGEYYTFSVNDLNSKVLLTRSDSTALYFKLASLTMLLFALVVSTKIIRKRRKFGYFNRNTSTRKMTSEDINFNKKIVETKLWDDETNII